jgi:protein-S-isoprenylcysteine O-methyltransferase Ste14
VPALALAFLAVYLVLTLGLRMALHQRRTGSFGFRGLSGGPGSAEWWGGAIFVLAWVVAAAAATLDLLGAVEPLGALDHAWARRLGLAIGGAGILGTFYAQGAMGKDWRIGVPEGERTGLVTGGPFAMVRNPIYSATIPTMAGFALIAGSAPALAALVVLVVGLEIQVRLSEEPHLLRAHGEAYRTYAARVGRFVPGLGRLR